MKVMIDGVDAPIEAEEKELIIQEVSTVLGGQNRVIMSVSVDGNEMDLDAFKALGGGLVANFSSMGIEELVLDSLHSVREYIPRLASGILKLADLLEEERSEEAMRVSLQAMEGFDWAVGSLDRCISLLGCHQSELEVKDFFRAKGELEKKLGSIVTSFEGGRFFQPAFVIREEIPAELEILKKTVDYLIKLSSSGKH